MSPLLNYKKIMLFPFKIVMLIYHLYAQARVQEGAQGPCTPPPL